MTSPPANPRAARYPPRGGAVQGWAGRAVAVAGSRGAQPARPARAPRSAAPSSRSRASPWAPWGWARRAPPSASLAPQRPGVPASRRAAGECPLGAAMYPEAPGGTRRVAGARFSGRHGVGAAPRSGRIWQSGPRASRSGLSDRWHWALHGMGPNATPSGQAARPRRPTPKRPLHFRGRMWIFGGVSPRAAVAWLWPSRGHAWGWGGAGRGGGDCVVDAAGRRGVGAVWKQR